MADQDALKSARDTFRSKLGLENTDNPETSLTGRSARSNHSLNSQRLNSSRSDVSALSQRSALVSARPSARASARESARGSARDSARSNFDSARTWRTEDMNTSRCEEMLNELKNTRKELMGRLRSVQEEIDAEDKALAASTGPKKTTKVREPVLKTRKPIFLKKPRTKKFLLKKY
ncbi:hypothetical protein TrST_g8818 [Triparma strigata]|uniref:Uncharacterized protein n=1 Tax=Triparma strigata TaxID=1606541 RepID=A0A9W7C6S4_9STRA|nr:hypothetical protein TrST_g8818 [Triparma strigata]